MRYTTRKHWMSRHLAFGAGLLGTAFLLALGTASSGCQDEDLSALNAEIRIVDLDDPARSLCATEFVKDCAHAFGDVSVGSAGLVSFLIDNPGRATLNVRSIAIEGSPEFSLQGVVPTAVDAGSGAAVSVRVAPTAPGPLHAQLLIASDAINGPVGGIVIDLTANGADLGAPSIRVEPARCDFGSVAVGVRALCTVSIANDGAQALSIDSLTLSNLDASATFGTFDFDTDIATPAAVQPGTATSVTLAATPSALGSFEGSLTIASNAGVVDVPLFVTGSQDPTAVARVKSVNGAPFSGSSVEPLDDVVLSGDQSVANIVGYAWTIVEKPSESSVTLSAPNSVDTGFVFSSSLGNTNGIDVAGTFRVRLTVTDAAGAVSTNDATVTLNSVPTGGLHVQLSWTASSNDLDLHLGRGFGVNWCSQDDCYYGNCADNAGVNWDGIAGGTPGDPRLDIDDTNGFGPENIQIEEPVDNSYIIGVHAYSGEGGGAGFTPTDVRVKVFINGALTETFDGHLSAKNQFWRVARIEVAGGAMSINPVDTVQDHLNSCE